jgi:opacity protein-like surface antigen
MLTIAPRVSERIKIKNVGRGPALGALLVAMAAASASAPATAANPLGFYIGAAFGRASVRNDEILFGPPGSGNATGFSFDEAHTAWKILVGARPVSLLGAELEYIDLGHPSASSAVGVVPVQADAQVKGAALFGLAYLPLPLPLLDIYGKAGFARLQTTANATYYGCDARKQICPAVVGPPNLSVFRLDRTDTRFAYGAGAQIKLAGFAVRAEYERVSESGGNPDLLSLGVSWTYH